MQHSQFQPNKNLGLVVFMIISLSLSLQDAYKVLIEEFCWALELPVALHNS